MIQSNAAEFNSIAKNIFYPIYPVIADQILFQVQGSKSGNCLDVGCGSGLLGMAIAQKSDMKLYCYDIDQEALDIAKNNFEEASLGDHAYYCHGNAEAIPYTDDFFELVTSRGSLFFWEDKVKAINEIYRVLKPGGIAYIGGGFGNAKLKQMIDSQMLKIDEKWLINAEKRKSSEESYTALMERTNVPNYEILSGEFGLWILFRKP